VVPVVSTGGTPGGMEAALRTGPYGRCVYHAGSDVVDHQVVAMELSDGSTMSLTFNGHSYQAGESVRTTRYDGTRASLRAVLGARSSIEIHDHAGGVETVELAASGDGHAGGDATMLEAWVEHLRTGTPMLTSAHDAVEAHVLAFAAEQARLSGAVIDVGAIWTDARGRSAH
jgi:hypothetical protein